MAARQPLERHQGAERDNRPAWMTKGLGVGEKMLGKARGDLMKPGLTKADLERIERGGGAGAGAPDPFGEVFRESGGKGGGKGGKGGGRGAIPKAPGPGTVHKAAGPGAVPKGAPAKAQVPAPLHKGAPGARPPMQRPPAKGPPAKGPPQRLMAMSRPKGPFHQRPAGGQGLAAARSKGAHGQGGRQFLRTKAAGTAGGPVLGTVPKAVGPTARRFLALNSKAPSAARWGSGGFPQQRVRGVFPKGAAGLRPPPRRAAQAAADEDDEYDPFAEQPAPHVAGAKAAIPPWRRGQAELPPPSSIRQQHELQARAVRALASTVPAPLPLPRMVSVSAVAAMKAKARGAVKGCGKGKGGRGLAKGAAKAAAAKAAVPKSAPRPPTEAELKAKAEAQAAAAEEWVDKRGPSRSMSAAAKIAEQHFARAEGGTKASASASAANQPAAKKRKVVEQVVGPAFTPELLGKAPAVLQTCRSLLQFLEKKLEEATPDKPELTGPKALLASLEALASLAGRLAGLGEKSGWDARAKRVLDLGAAAKDGAGEAALKAAQSRLEGLQQGLRHKLKDAGEERELEAIVAERQAWEQARLKRAWLAWCAQLLRVKEGVLLAEADGKPAPQPAAGQKKLGAVEVFQAILSGEVPPEGPKRP